jgi:hypothetical protein
MRPRDQVASAHRDAAVPHRLIDCRAVNHFCQVCRVIEDLPAWFYQRTRAVQGRQYVCAAQHAAMPDAAKTAWKHVDPADPLETQQIRYCYYCDTPLGGIQQFDQGFHDRCHANATTPKKTRRGGGGRGRSRRGSRR